MTSPYVALSQARCVLFAHAHPDDETLSTGALIADLSARGVRCVVVTATRGECGEVRPEAAAELGAQAGGGTSSSEDALVALREREWRSAGHRLGVASQEFLGRNAGRRYRDSGMRWVCPGVAGPAETRLDAFTRLPMEDAVADLQAAIAAHRPDYVVSYDDAGTYGHPDHLRMCQVARAACTDVPLIEIVSERAGTDPSALPGWQALPATENAVAAALACYHSQVVVRNTREAGSGVVEIEHVGGQQQSLPCGIALVWSGAGVAH
ncbi:MAG: PIG-L family deacetylase [Bowdeniella nasicola]|nr:PIG-L family deacetylase [Bowdeniella nasicola]